LGLATGNIKEGDRFGSIRITSGHQYAAAVKDKCDLGLYLSEYSKKNGEELVLCTRLWCLGNADSNWNRCKKRKGISSLQEETETLWLV